MFFLSGNLTILSSHDLLETARRVARRLGIPPFQKDTSGRWEEVEVYISMCFGLQFMFCRPPDAKSADEFGLTISSVTDDIPYDGSEKEVDVARYAAMLLAGEPGISATPDPATARS